MEVVEDVALHVAEESTFPNEPMSIDFIDNTYVKLDTELGSCDHVQAEERNFDEISSTAIDEVISGVSMKHGTDVAGDADLRYDTGDASLETVVDQGEAVTLTDDKAAIVDEVKPSSATGSESDVAREAGDVSQIVVGHEGVAAVAGAFTKDGEAVEATQGWCRCSLVQSFTGDNEAAKSAWMDGRGAPNEPVSGENTDTIVFICAGTCGQRRRGSGDSRRQKY
ncbi:hypothetical protein ZWY2020_008634 [Hordeum vulgare]|nr:hypothetical protein ZWY2020_008634 [Hordeum vulgare]